MHTGVLPLLLLLLATALVCRAAISSKRVVRTDAASLLFRADYTQGRSLVDDVNPITYQVIISDPGDHSFLSYCPHLFALDSLSPADELIGAHRTVCVLAGELWTPRRMLAHVPLSGLGVLTEPNPTSAADLACGGAP